MTIYALSSGPGISGVAVIRLSGQDTSKVIQLLTDKELPKPRVATLRKINKINTSGFLGLRATQAKIWLKFKFMAVKLL